MAGTKLEKAALTVILLGGVKTSSSIIYAVVAKPYSTQSANCWPKWLYFARYGTSLLQANTQCERCVETVFLMGAEELSGFGQRIFIY